MTKSEIIQAAFETWGAGRYQTTSLAELAGALGVSKTALYHHFRNKEDILGAMRETFIDRLADSLRPLFENTLVRLNQDAGKPESLEAILCINSGMTEFFAENPWYFMFSLIKLHGNTDVGLNIADHLREQGLDFEKFLRFTDNIDGKTAYPPIYQLVFTYSLCIISNFLKDLWEKGHLKAGFRESPPPGVPEIIQKVNDVVRRGLGFRREKIDSLDWKTLEAAAEWRETGGGGGKRKWLIKAVASVVAAAGPWAASMAMVAKESGLSKSGLYSHFASKRDMLRQLFLEEFDEVIRYAQAVSRKSSVPEEQLYLAIRAVAGFMTSEPEFLAAISSLKTRRINFDVDMTEDMKKNRDECHVRFFQIFSGIRNADGEPLLDETATGAILFLLTDTLIRKPDSMDYKSIPDESLRILYRFIALGTDGVE